MEIEREERNGSGYQEKQEFITGLYYEYERLMFATARRYIDDRTEQEDVVQESLKKLIEKQERLAGLAQAAQAGYVATTVRNTAISILRETHRDNQSMQNAILNYGFVECGNIYVRGGAERIAYDYSLEL